MCIIGFCDQVSSWSLSLEWTEELCNEKTSLIGDWSRILGFAQLVSHILGSHASKQGTVTTEQVQLGIRLRVQL